MAETRVAATYAQLLYEYLENQGLDAARFWVRPGRTTASTLYP